MPSDDMSEEEFFYGVMSIVTGIKEAATHLENALVSEREMRLAHEAQRRHNKEPLTVLRGGRNA